MPLLKQVVEALVFASQKPLVPREIAAALKAAADDTEDIAAKALGKTKEAEIGAALEEIKLEIETANRAYKLVEQINGWHFVSDPAYGPWVRQLYPESKPVRLSGPALETLAIIAYRQPITRADIEAVRGVAVDGMVNMLLERGLIRIAGRSDAPGRPLLYESTEYFLEHFGLKTLDELPNSAELRRLNLPTAPASPGSEKPSAYGGETAENRPANDAAATSEVVGKTAGAETQGDAIEAVAEVIAEEEIADEAAHAAGADAEIGAPKEPVVETIAHDNTEGPE